MRQDPALPGSAGSTMFAKMSLGTLGALALLAAWLALRPAAVATPDRPSPTGFDATRALAHMRMLAQTIAEGNWIASILFGRAMSSLYGGYTTGFMWNFFGIKNMVTIAIALFLTWEGQRRDSRVRQMTQALARRR